MAGKQVRKVVGIVGPCGSGKTTLVNRLNGLGINARHIAQEHSYVGAMWQKITHPDYLIFLDASYAETIRRRKLDWTMDEYQEQHRRLAHARQNADLYIFTDPLKPAEICQIVLDFLKDHAIYPEDG
jgi:energy-coupling factor transporter ATP-binding protein EcfA2